MNPYISIEKESKLMNISLERKKKEEKKYTEKLKNVTSDVIKSKKKCSENKREKLNIYF